MIITIELMLTLQINQNQHHFEEITMSRMWPMGYVVYGCKNRPVQTLSLWLQINFAEFEIRVIADYLRGLKMIKLSNGVEISEDTVVASLKKCGIKVEPEQPPKVLLYGTTKGNDNDIYLKVSQYGNSVIAESVTKDGSWRKTICEFSTRGLQLFTSADKAGFPTDGGLQKIKLI